MAMEEAQSTTQSSSSKRQRDVAQETLVLEDPNKRQKSYNHILSLLDEEEEEEEPTQDLNSLISTFHQELSSDALTNPDQVTADASDASEGYNSSSSGSSSPSSELFLEEESSVERVMRHLLEASDDELGIPQREGGNGFKNAEEVVSFEDNVLYLCDGLWELEDEAANYYALVQSELFM